MAQLLTLITNLQDSPELPDVRLPSSYETRRTRVEDADELGRLYFEAYETGVACGFLREAIDEIRASFAGEYGELWPEASLVVEHDHVPVGAILTVRQGPWKRTPDCPFIIDLFVDKSRRRRGLGRDLVHLCMATASESGEPAVALRVAGDNSTARALYRSLGFVEWHPQP